jgi:hypothetical protein
MGVREQVGGLPDHLRRELGHRDYVTDLAGHAEHRHGVGHRRRLGRQPGQPQHQCTGDGVRPEGFNLRSGVGTRLDPVGAQGTDQLGEQERVAATCLVAG